MKVVGFSFNKISIERNKESSKDTGKDLKINTNIEILDIEQPTIELFKGSKVFDFKYKFKVIYEPGIAELLMEGSILSIIDDEDLIKKIMKEWKNKVVLEEIRIPLLNKIYAKCNLKAFQIEEDLNLPLHMPMPRLVGMEPVDTLDKPNKK
ncbi:MAG: hypothetical protein AABX03_04875 [Nanoarchaeota archaeon]